MNKGFQSAHKRSMKQAGLQQNRNERHIETVAKLHRNCILVDGTLTVGFGPNPPGKFRDLGEMIRVMTLDSDTLSFYTPCPGRFVFDPLHSEGRIADRNWACYERDQAVVEPPGISSSDLGREF